MASKEFVYYSLHKSKGKIKEGQRYGTFDNKRRLQKFRGTY